MPIVFNKHMINNALIPTIIEEQVMMSLQLVDIQLLIASEVVMSKMNLLFKVMGILMLLTNVSVSAANIENTSTCQVTCFGDPNIQPFLAKSISVPGKLVGADCVLQDEDNQSLWAELHFDREKYNNLCNQRIYECSQLDGGCKASWHDDARLFQMTSGFHSLM